MLNNTEYNNVVICMCPNGYTPEECYALLEAGYIGFPNIRKLVKSAYAYLVEEIDAICEAYNKLCIELRDAGMTELLEVAYDDLLRDLDLCRARWVGKIDERRLNIAFNN